MIAVVRAAGMTERTTLQSFDWRTLRYAQKVAPEIQTVCLTVQQPGDDNIQAGQPGPSPLLAGLDVDDYRRIGAEARDGGRLRRVVAQRARPEPGAVAEAHAQRLDGRPWTVNEESAMNALAESGVDGIITDYPDRLRKVLARRGMSLPTPSKLRQ